MVEIEAKKYGKYKSPRWLAWKCWLAVNNPIGKKRYNQNTEKNHDIVRKFVEVE